MLVAQVFRSGMSRKIIKELGAKPPRNDFRPEKFYGKIWTFEE
jgi:hypothetical protein